MFNYFRARLPPLALADASHAAQIHARGANSRPTQARWYWIMVSLKFPSMIWTHSLPIVFHSPSVYITPHGMLAFSCRINDSIAIAIAFIQWNFTRTSYLGPLSLQVRLAFFKIIGARGLRPPACLMLWRKDNHLVLEFKYLWPISNVFVQESRAKARVQHIDDRIWTFMQESPLNETWLGVIAGITTNMMTWNYLSVQEKFACLQALTLQRKLGIHIGDTRRLREPWKWLFLEGFQKNFKQPHGWTYLPWPGPAFRSRHPLAGCCWLPSNMRPMGCFFLFWHFFKHWVKLLYHFIQFGSHASRGPPKHWNVTVVMVEISWCQNHFVKNKIPKNFGHSAACFGLFLV